MKLKIYYRKNLQMSQGKLAAQCVHAAGLAGFSGQDVPVIVLGLSDRKFDAMKASHPVCVDAGWTELAPGTETAFAVWE